MVLLDHKGLREWLVRKVSKVFLDSKVTRAALVLSVSRDLLDRSDSQEI